MLVALASQNVTLVSGRYEGVLIDALALTVGANACFVLASRRGGRVVRLLCSLFVLPTVFVVVDFVRRAPYVFR